MGNKQSQKTTVTIYDHAEGKHIGTHRSVSQVLLSTEGNVQAQGQILHLDPTHNIDKQIEIYQYRKDQENALVKCVAVHLQKTQSKSLCGNKQILRVLTERIPSRLNELPQLTFQESVYVLTQSLRGYKDCFNKLGPFQVTSEMIGINNDGEIKVWVNPDFAQNHPLTERPLLFTSGTYSKKQERTQDFVGKRDQSEMIKNVIGLVEKKCESGRFPSDFSETINKNASSFDKIFGQIESYVVQRKLFIPDRIIDMNMVYPKGKYFTPGQQYVRDEDDPLYRKRKPFLPQPKQLNLEPLEGGRHSNYKQAKLPELTKKAQLPDLTNKNGRVNSLILSLYQQDGRVNIEQGQRMLHSPRNQGRDLQSDVTFNMRSPEIQGMVSNAEDSVYPNEVYGRR